jgi:hypothetical protein
MSHGGVWTHAKWRDDLNCRFCGMRARARIRPYGKQSRFFVFFSLKNPLTVCLCRVPKIGGVINSSNYGLTPLPNFFIIKPYTLSAKSQSLNS